METINIGFTAPSNLGGHHQGEEITKQIEKEIEGIYQHSVANVILGGAPGGDEVALRKAMSLDPEAKRIHVFAPGGSMKGYIQYCTDLGRADLIELLDTLMQKNPNAVHFFSSPPRRNFEIARESDILFAYYILQTEGGVLDTIEHAEELNDGRADRKSGWYGENPDSVLRLPNHKTDIRKRVFRPYRNRK